MTPDLFAQEYCPLFEGIEKEEMISMFRCLDAREERRARGEFLLAAGTAADWMGVVLTGSADVSATDYDGNRRILTHIGPGQLFAESFACAGCQSVPVDVTAAEDMSFLRLDARRLTRSCAGACPFHTRLIQNLLRIVSEKNVQFHRKLAVISRRTTRDRLLTYLEEMARQQGSRCFSIPFDRQALADYLGVDRSGLSAEIGRLRAEGVLSSRKNRFILHGTGGEKSFAIDPIHAIIDTRSRQKQG